MSLKRLIAMAVAALGTVFGITAQVGLESDSLVTGSWQGAPSAPAITPSETTSALGAKAIKFDPYAVLPRHCSNPSPYALPYSLTGSSHDWRRLWINTGVLSGAFVGTLLVLECLPEDATSWNRDELQSVPLFKRWKQHVIDKGCEWDHDKFIFNYVLHPYAGAVYFMSARSLGFNFYQSMLYCTLISNVGWEFGVEAFMERPSYQDLFITPLVGSALGEGFYMLKRHLVDNNYELGGSRVLGNIVAFLIDPVNEVIGIFDHNPARVVSRAKAGDPRYSPRAQMTLNVGPRNLSFRLEF